MPDDRLDAYRRLRKRMPPPEQVERDRRRALAEEQADIEMEEALAEREQERTAARKRRGAGKRGAS